LNVVNTILPNSVIDAVHKIRKQREIQHIDEQPIKVTNEFAELLSSFTSI